jgi:glucosylceramidase
MKTAVLSTCFFLLLFCAQQKEDAAMKGKKAHPLAKATIYLTAKDSDYRLSETARLSFEDLIQPDEHNATIMIDINKTFQTIEGFGGALTDASAETFYKLPENRQQEILTAYFDPDKGIGYTICRTHINSCDFSSESYAYTEIAGDTALEHFSIDHDRMYRIPFIKSALRAAGGQLGLFASPWSPPAWMKTNNHMLQGGKLKPEYAQAWANYYVRFIQEYEKEGIPVWGLTVQNEPMAKQIWESCIYTAADERDFVKNYLGPTLHKAGMADKKLIIWDHNRGIMYQRAQIVLQDPLTAQYVWGTGFHWYTGDHFDNVRLVHEAFPDKKLIFTEGCVYPFSWEHIDEWHWGERYAESILKDLNNWCVAWVDWNVLLDETGGPNHVANFCYAPVIGDTRDGKLVYMNSYYYMGHFSKFIRPGAKRIICSSNLDDLLATAFLNPDGKIVVIALNMTDTSIPFSIWIDGQVLKTESPVHSIITAIL